MARKCSVCIHPKRQYINRMLLGMDKTGRTYREISEKYSLSQTALARHRQEHLLPTIAEKKTVDRDEQFYDAFQEFIELVEDAKKASHGEDEVVNLRNRQERRTLLKIFFDLQLDAWRLITQSNTKTKEETEQTVDDIMKRIFGR